MLNDEDSLSTEIMFIPSTYSFTYPKKDSEVFSIFDSFSDSRKRNVQVDKLIRIIDSDSEESAVSVATDSKIIKEDEDFLKILQKFDDKTKLIKDANNELLAKHESFIAKNEDASFIASEVSKVHGSQFFREVPKYFVNHFGLIQEFDVLPDLIHRYLDFRYNNEICELKEKKIRKIREKKKVKSVRSLQIKPLKDYRRGKQQVISLLIEPDTIIFHNCEPGNVYKKTAKLLNIGTSLQTFSFKSQPKLQYFSVNMETTKLAPGMANCLTVTYEPKIYRDVIEHVTLKDNQGQMANLVLKSTRDRPKLFICLLKPNVDILKRSSPGSENFKEKRREALNSTIDCGSCFVGQYIVVSLIIENVGMPAKFFIIQEDDWFFQKVETVSISLELQTKEFWMYPSFFEIKNSGMIEVLIIFHPSSRGLHLETLYFICDNNSYAEVEIMGDALNFSRSSIRIDIPPQDFDISSKTDYIVSFGHVQNKTFGELSIEVHNDSPIYLKCNWLFTNKPNQQQHVKDLQKDSIKIKTPINELPPYSKTTFVFEICFDEKIPAYYNIFFNFFVLDIPEIALMEEERFVLAPRKTPLGNSLDQTLDILIASFEMACFIDIPVPEKTICLCNEDYNKPRQSKVQFSSCILNFGTLPLGVEIEKELFIECTTDDLVEWFLVELRYNIDSLPHVTILNTPHVDVTNGTFCCKSQEKKIFYTVATKEPCQWVSVLLLTTYSTKSDQVFIESGCVVTYSVIQYDIRIETGHCESPIMCPMKMLYKNVPEEFTIKIENFSSISGCFYFLKPQGSDSDKIKIEFQPNSSVLKPYQSLEVQVKLCCTGSGTLEDVKVPCFIGSRQKPIMLRVLCVVDDIHVIFYLPDPVKSHQKIMWPPQIIYEFDNNPWYCLCGEGVCFFEPLESDNDKVATSNIISDQISENFAKSKDFQDQFPETKSSITSSSNAGSYLREILRDQFGKEMILQEVVEVRQMSANKPHKVSLYIQNLTPVEASYTIEVQNFNATEDFDEESPKFILHKEGNFSKYLLIFWIMIGTSYTPKNGIAPILYPETITSATMLYILGGTCGEAWNALINPKNGILVHPVKETGKITKFGWNKLDLVIYANTWGIYLEEVAIDIEDIQCYTFSLIIEVTGSIFFPMGLNALTEFPAVRLGIIPYRSETFNRKIELRNDSCIPVKLFWESFLQIDGQEIDPQRFNVAFYLNEDSEKKAELILTHEYYGLQRSGFCRVVPEYSTVAANSSIFIDLIIQPSYFDQEQDETKEIICYVVGHIVLDEEDRLKPHYYYRDTTAATKKTKLKVTATLKIPCLEIDCSQTNPLFVYYDQILTNNNNNLTCKLVIHNKEMIDFEIRISVPEPFKLMENNEMKSTRRLNIGAYKTAEIGMKCCLKCEQLMQLSSLLFNPELTPNDIEDIVKCKFEVDLDNSVLKLILGGEISNHSGKKQFFPLSICIRFPDFFVNPNEVDFESVLVGDTAKRCVVVYNNSEHRTEFECYKSSTAENFYITPHYGEIPGSTGRNKQFAYIFIYFTPMKCKLYHESFMVATTIPNCRVEIPLKGVGTIDEKFHVTYKI